MLSVCKRKKLKMVKKISKKCGCDFGGWICGKELYKSEDYYGYEPSYLIDDVMSQLQICQDDKIIDLGCGKGYAIYLLSAYPFSEIDGIEKMNELADIAKHNIQTIIRRNDIKIFVEDVNRWDGFCNYNYFYLFNPFGLETINYVAKKIKLASLSSNKKMTVIYQVGDYIEAFVLQGFRIVMQTKYNCVLVISPDCC